MRVTEKLYYSDRYMLEFAAEVLATRSLEEGKGPGRFHVVLDRTCFYPGGGGQPSDRGTLGRAKVVDVFEEGEDIVHVVDSPVAAGEVRGVVDAARRLDFMAQHTGQHILSQSLLASGGLETVSVHFGDETTGIEVASPVVEDTVLRTAEELANRIVQENRRVRIHEIDPSEAGRFPLRRPPPDAGRLRIVEIEGFDWSACSGVHVAGTGEIGLIKIVAAEKLRGHLRIHAAIGRRALLDYGRKIALLQRLSAALTCGEAEMLARVEELLARDRDRARELRRLRTEQGQSLAREAVAAGRRVGDAILVQHLFDDAGQEVLKGFVDSIVSEPARIAVAADRGPEGFQWIAAHSLAHPIGGTGDPSNATGDTILDLPRIISPLLGIADARGGGKAARMQGSGRDTKAATDLIEAICREIRRALGQTP